MHFTITNCVYTSHCHKEIDLRGPPLTDHPKYVAPGWRFPGGRLKLKNGTALIFKDGKVVMTGCKDDEVLLELILVLEDLLDCSFETTKIRNVCGSINVGEPIDLYFYANVTSRVEYTPDLHPGAFLRYGKVSFILYHTGKGIFTGCRDTIHYDEICEKIRETVYNYKRRIHERSDFYAKLHTFYWTLKN
jgi:TATA-box binding protein (TBP) (component of TFIID and TFIIIB)